MSELRVRISGHDLPGRRFDDRRLAGVVREHVHVGLQRGQDLVDLQPADLDKVRFEARFRVGEQPDGSPNFLGPYAHGRPAERFFYLGWVEGDVDLPDRRFRRAKVRLAGAVTPSMIAAAGDRGLDVRVALTGDDGGPLCGGFGNTDSRVSWSA